VADTRTGPTVRRRRQPGTGESHAVFGDQMQDLTNAVQQCIMPKSSQRCTRLADYSTCPIPPEPTQYHRSFTFLPSVRAGIRPAFPPAPGGHPLARTRPTGEIRRRESQRISAAGLSRPLGILCRRRYNSRSLENSPR
jgi:hypothetical protein